MMEIFKELKKFQSSLYFYFSYYIYLEGFVSILGRKKSNGIWTKGFNWNVLRKSCNRWRHTMNYKKKPNRKAQYAKGQNPTGSNAISKRKDV